MDNYDFNNSNNMNEKHTPKFFADIIVVDDKIQQKRRANRADRQHNSAPKFYLVFPIRLVPAPAVFEKRAVIYNVRLIRSFKYV